jgi:hypothetical protein
MSFNSNKVLFPLASGDLKFMEIITESSAHIAQETRDVSTEKGRGVAWYVSF